MFNLCYTLGNDDARKAGTIIESAFSDLRYTLGDDDAFETIALLKSSLRLQQLFSHITMRTSVNP